MKITYYNKTVRATAESLEDIKTLLALNTPTAPVKQPKEDTIVHRRRQHKKLCDICGKKYRGLTMHKKMKHPILETTSPII